MNDYVTLPISESIRRVNDVHTAAMYVEDMVEYHTNVPGSTQNTLTKIRTFLMTPPHGYRYTARQYDTLLRLHAAFAAKLGYKSAKPYIQYEQTKSFVWRKGA